MIIERLKHQWMPITTVKKISSKPQRFVLLGIPIVIYKINNQIIALQDRCPHRGAPLSSGKLEGVLLQCPYHGWRFNQSGKCIKIPGLEKKINLADKNVPAYPTQIYMGLVFVCLNKNETTLPLYNISVLNSRKYSSYLIQFELEGDILNIIENTLDATHTHYIHAGLLRHDNKRQTIKANLKVNEHFAEVYYEDKQKQSGLISSLFERNRKSSVGRFHFPLIVELEYYSKEHLTASFTFYLSPITEKKHRAFLLISYRYHWLTSWVKKLTFLPFIKMALKQDISILTKQENNSIYFPSASYKSTELDLLRPHIERIFENKAQIYQKTISLNI